MMDKLTEEEQFLLLGKMTGTLSPEEEIALEKLFKDNPYATEAYKELENNIPVADQSAYFAHREQAPSWKDLTPQLRPARRIPFYKRNWVAAAILLGILAGAGILLILRPSHKDVAAVQTTKPGLALTLADGKVIDLASQQGHIAAGSAQLNNTNKSLTYSSKNDPPAGTNTLAVPVGMDYKLTLADGSEIWLNAATKLEFPFSFTGKSREISIDGEAYINVAKDATRPFIVHLPKSNVQVLGTVFNVNTYDKGVEKVALIEGAVRLKTPDEETIVTPGNQAVYKEGNSVTQEAFDPKYVLSWRKGLFYFDDASLQDISKVVPRWYGIKLVIDNPEINNRRFTGVINRNRPIRFFLDDLKVIAKIDAWFDQDSTLHLKQH